jgi:hypothetical protein
MDHLLLHCEIASAIWNSIFGLFSLAWAMPHRVRFLFACWRGQFGSPQSKAVWRMIPLWLMLCIGRQGNDRSFEDSEMTGASKAFFLIPFSFEWLLMIAIIFLVFMTFCCFFFFWLGSSLYT